MCECLVMCDIRSWCPISCQSSISDAHSLCLPQLVAYEDAQGPAAPETMVSRERFVSIVSELVSGDTDSAGEMYNCIVRYLEEQGLDRTSRESDDLKASRRPGPGKTLMSRSIQVGPLLSSPRPSLSRPRRCSVEHRAKFRPGSGRTRRHGPTPSKLGRIRHSPCLDMLNSVHMVSTSFRI